MALSDDDVAAAAEKARLIIREVSKVVLGKEETVKLVLAALLAEGHILIEGMPGTAKTLTARAFAKTIGGVFKRIQFTPDTMPADIIGFYLYTPTGARSLVKGPIFANILLADELNRAPPRTQAALLEAMQECSVTIEGNTFQLPRPFMVIATQLPHGFAGTYALPEVLVDRFMFRLWSDYNPPETEVEIMENIDYIDELPVERVATPEDVLAMRSLVKKVHVSREILGYIEDVLRAVRQDPNVLIGPSTRAAIALYKGARALAMLDGRSYVIPDDVKELLHPVLDHRVRVRAEAEVEGVRPEDIVEKALSEVPVPK